MDANFWQQRWASNQIGFHGEVTHPQLMQHWPSLGLAPDARVFVPLCGKSLDLRWLRAQGHAVVGVELSPIAIEAFFAELQLTPVLTQDGPFTRYAAAGYTIFCGDYFATTTSRLGAFDAVYDRAALIALPPPLRTDYARHLGTLAQRAARVLLITVQYAPDQVTPPPFAVADSEVSSSYGADWQVTRLAQTPADVKGAPGSETMFRLERR